MRAPGSLRARIVLAALAALLLTGLVCGGLLLAAVERDGRRAVDEALVERAERVLRPAGGPGTGRPGPFGEGPRGREPLLEGSGVGVQVALDGQIVQQRGDVPAGAPGPPARDGLSTVEIDGEPWRALTVTPTILDEPGRVRVQFLTTLAPVQARVAGVRRLVVLLGLLALGLLALTTWVFTTLALRPLDRLRAGAERVSGDEDLAAPLAAGEGPVEVRALAGALNAMLGRLRASSEGMRRALEATRRFAADAGHELRTPLTGLRANLEALERNPDLPAGQREAIVRETLAEQERMVHLLAGLQALARGEASESLPREDVEVADLVDAAVYAARRRHPGVDLELVDEAGDALVRGWAGGLRLLVDNLLDNAALHGRPGGRVRAALASDGDDVVLRVEDDGPGVAPEERERLLEPFARGADARAPGTGLGLAIVAQQVALHGGELRLERSELGGLRVAVRLPATARVAEREQAVAS